MSKDDGPGYGEMVMCGAKERAPDGTWQWCPRPATTTLHTEDATYPVCTPHLNIGKGRRPDLTEGTA